MKNLKKLALVVVAIFATMSAQAQSDQAVEVYSLLMGGQTTEALAKVAELIEAAPNDYNLHVLQANIYRQQLRYADAVNSLNLALALSPGNARIFELLSDSYSQQGKYAAAEKVAHELYLLDTANLVNGFRLASVWQSQGKHGKALAMLEQITAVDTSNILYVKNLCDCYVRNEKMGNAAECYAYALTLDSLNVQLWMSLANVYFRMKMHDFSAEMASRGYAVDSTNTELLKLSGISLFHLGKLRQSVAQLKRAYKLGDTSTLVNKYLGFASYNLGENDDALFHLQKAYTGDSLNIETLYFYGSALSYRDRVEARKLLRKAIRLMQPDSVFLSLLYESDAFVSSGSNAKKEAYELYRKAYELNPQKEQLILSMATTLFSMNEHQASLDMFRLYLREVGESENDHADTKNSNVLQARHYIEMLKEKIFFLEGRERKQ
ncbi:MAG: tetratricopeptide repeat protein [Prevotellaceae bacterium]|jgi:tetratricopeptide (TPR) repeat protein|nr:tetratricopeptide repeat protein [Prevotellaceae bacterium]